MIAGGALVIPIGLLAQLASSGPWPPPRLATDTTIVERRAVDAVLAVEERLGRRTEEMPHNHPGYDIRSTSRDGTVTFIEVKGRISGADSFIVTQNELRFAANVPDSYLLALVDVSPDGPVHDQVRYLRRPYGADVRLPLDTTAASLKMAGLLAARRRADMTAVIELPASDLERNRPPIWKDRALRSCSLRKLVSPLQASAPPLHMSASASR